MGTHSSLRDAIQEHFDETVEERMEVITCSNRSAIPSLADYRDRLDQLRRQRPFSAVELKAVATMLPLVERRQEEDDRDRLMQFEADLAYELRRRDVLQGTDPISGEHFTTQEGYLRRVKALGPLTSGEHRLYMQWQAVVLDSIADAAESAASL